MALVKANHRADADESATVLTVIVWMVSLPLLNVLLPFVFQLWNELSVVSFFGEVPSTAEFEAQLWKIYVARALSIAGNLLILCASATLHGRGVRRGNHYVALIVSIGFTVLWFWVNGGW